MLARMFERGVHRGGHVVAGAGHGANTALFAVDDLLLGRCRCARRSPRQVRQVALAMGFRKPADAFGPHASTPCGPGDLSDIIGALDRPAARTVGPNPAGRRTGVMNFFVISSRAGDRPGAGSVRRRGRGGRYGWCRHSAAARTSWAVVTVNGAGLRSSASRREFHGLAIDTPADSDWRAERHGAQMVARSPA